MATSIKSIDLTAKTYQSQVGLAKNLHGVIEELAVENVMSKSTKLFQDLAGTRIDTKILHLALPNVVLNPGQAQALQDAVVYGAQRGVTVVYVAVP